MASDRLKGFSSSDADHEYGLRLVMSTEPGPLYGQNPFKTSPSSKASSSNQSELQEQLAAEATAAVQGELDQLRKKCEEAEEQQARTQRELEEYKKITEKNSKEMEETNVLIKKLLSLHGNSSST